MLAELPRVPLSCRRASALLCWIAGVLSNPACGPAAKTPLAATATTGLPPYDAAAAVLFDDSIAPEVFGLGVQRPTPHAARVLNDRSKLADTVARVKLRTIREERFDESLRYKVVFEPLGDPLAGAPLPADVELSVGRASPSLSTLRSMSVEAVGTKFVLLLKQYQLNSEPVLHFRGEPDRSEITEAILKSRKGGSQPPAE
jgi:hypothetical protein